MDLREAIQHWEADNGASRNEGGEGVRNLCRLANALGYQDAMKFGQFERGCYGDLIEFLEDNPGCVEAIKDWIMELDVPEWVEALGYTDAEFEEE